MSIIAVKTSADGPMRTISRDAEPLELLGTTLILS
jgi:hypothetical protein